MSLRRKLLTEVKGEINVRNNHKSTQKFGKELKEEFGKNLTNVLENCPSNSPLHVLMCKERITSG